MNDFTLRKTTGVSRLFNERTHLTVVDFVLNQNFSLRRLKERDAAHSQDASPSTGKKGAERGTMKKIVSETAEYPFTQSRVTIGARHNKICAVLE